MSASLVAEQQPAGVSSVRLPAGVLLRNEMMTTLLPRVLLLRRGARWCQGVPGGGGRERRREGERRRDGVANHVSPFQ